MGSLPGRKYADWSSKEGWLFKDIIHIFYKQGLRGTELAKAFRSLVPKEVYTHFIKEDVTDNAIDNRGHKGIYPKNAFEHPDKHPIGILMMPYAQQIVKNQQTITLDDVNEFVQQAKDTPMTPEEAPNYELKVFADATATVRKGFGYLYFLVSPLNAYHTAIGKALDPLKRINTHAKGDVTATMKIYLYLWCEEYDDVERYLKNKCSDERIKHEDSSVTEIFHVFAEQMVIYAEGYCDRKRYSHRRLTKEGYEEEQKEKQQMNPTTLTRTMNQ